jgi:hypothetical protein
LFPPMQSGLTLMPLRPRLRNSMLWLLYDWNR